MSRILRETRRSMKRLEAAGFGKPSGDDPNAHIGSSFDSFLENEGTLDEVKAVAAKRVTEWESTNDAPLAAIKAGLDPERRSRIESRAKEIVETNDDDEAAEIGYLLTDNTPTELATEIVRLRRDCSEFYQVIGDLADKAELFEDPQTSKALDNACAAAEGTARPHDDLLPFTAGAKG